MLHAAEDTDYKGILHLPAILFCSFYTLIEFVLSRAMAESPVRGVSGSLLSGCTSQRDGEYGLGNEVYKPRAGGSGFGMEIGPFVVLASPPIGRVERHKVSYL